ncbi:MAG: arginase family protein, partial [Nanoarchaeota archaeon]
MEIQKNAFIVKIPGFNGLGKTGGCENAGNAILSSLREIYSNEQGKVINVDGLDLEEIHLDNKNLELSNKLIYKNSLEIFETQEKTIFLGGDHSISYSTTKAFLDYAKNLEKKPCLIIFDAHSDCMKPVDRNFPTHEEWLRAVIEAGFPQENILLVGTRNIDEQEADFLKKKNIRIITMNQLTEDLHDSCDIIMEFSNGKELYVSIDIDVIDPAFAPSTGYSEPGGLTSRDFLYMIQKNGRAT